jgi:hypothetical protein
VLLLGPPPLLLSPPEPPLTVLPPVCTLLLELLWPADALLAVVPAEGLPDPPPGAPALEVASLDNREPASEPPEPLEPPTHELACVELPPMFWPLSDDWETESPPREPPV